MRDLIVFAVIFSILPIALFRPTVGVMLFAWISLMNPHRLAYGAANAFPFAAIVAAVTLLAVLITPRRQRFPMTPLTGLILLFMAWTTVTSLTALEPQLVWPEWQRVMKTLFMILIAMYAVNEEKDLKTLVWVIAGSIAFYGFKGGIFTIATGGKSHVFGPDDSYISDNNALALALITVLPLLWYLQSLLKQTWRRIAVGLVALLTLIAAAGSYSRGAFLAGITMLLFLWWKSRQKLTTGIIVLLCIPILYLVMPAEWFSRMDTIDNYQGDDSALGRLNAWGFAIKVATTHFLGGGFSVFSPTMFLIYAPNPLNHHAAHSIYFQVLGEHGFIGLGLYLAMMIAAWVTAARIARSCRGQPELQWAGGLAETVQVSLIGFAVGGAFLSMAYYDLYYYLMVILVVLQKLLRTPEKLPWRDDPTVGQVGPLATTE